MNAIRIHSPVAALASAIAVLVLTTSPAMAGDRLDNDRRVTVAFTKWSTTFPAQAGFVKGDLNLTFVGHVFEALVSANGHVTRLEAMYEVHDGDRSFTALVTGGMSAAGLGLLDGVILDGWRTGARVQVMFLRATAPSPTESACAGAPAGKTCFEGTILVGRAPRE